jgi:hypothetical protein
MRVKINYTQKIEYSVELDWAEIIATDNGDNSLPTEDQVRNGEYHVTNIVPEYELAGLLEGESYEVDSEAIRITEIYSLPD